MKRVLFVSVLVVFLLFSCATGKTLERVETEVEEIPVEKEMEKVEDTSPLIPIVDEEEEEVDLSTLNLFYSDGEFYDFKNIEKEEEIPVVPQKGQEEVIKEEIVDEKKEGGINILTYVLLSIFLLLCILILFVALKDRKTKTVIEKEEIWEEEEEYSSLLEILEEE